ncbi:ABC transporter ATP-binding protein [Actinoplanes xinjiangensis]|uniref:ABC-2 type transport system ATP-binding protein n=1 Tax=Actinoplanes xinjiangensis TaxID=512350 RepID=A0A316FXC1_9ACTN|nr:ATP-binding cassette domain-containing protein [Actinoplanes xinjiangensis]PWK46727.1 ABC-2 type transport system ATP-binding protein [Actinoplanes xinjiangensis]GIF40450.1 ABC transporter ATP-binding protein [Actinoplanes xinjiangensis]
MLNFDRVVKSFGPKRVLNELSLTVRPGELYGFCGANGAGKTTAMRIALGVHPADGGSVTIDGRPIDAELRAQIGYMPEERGLYAKMRPVDQLVYLAKLSGVRPDEASRRAAEWIERLGVVMSPKDPLEKLSLGNQQKVQLIAALMAEPRVLVLDEPFSGLDPVAVDAMADVLLEQARKGIPVLFSSHQLDLVDRLCDRIGIIRGGRIVAEGTVGELRAKVAGRLLQISLQGAEAGWPENVPGVRRVDDHDGLVSFELTAGTDPDDVLDAVRRLGRIEHFGWRNPSLSDIFREAVTA